MMAPQIVQPNTANQAPALAPQQDSVEDSNSSLHKIVSPMVGTFYRSPSPEAGPFVSPGTR